MKKKDTFDIKGFTLSGAVLDELDAPFTPDVTPEMKAEVSSSIAAISLDPIITPVAPPVVALHELDDLGAPTGFMQVVPCTFAEFTPDPDPVDDFRSMIDDFRYAASLPERRFEITNPGIDASGFMEMMLNATRNGRAMIIPNDTNFEYSEEPVSPKYPVDETRMK